MNPDDFYQMVHLAFMLPPGPRHRGMLKLQEQIHAGYSRAVGAIDTQRAAQTSSDGRTILQVVGHIAEWDRWMLLGAAEMLSGASSPQMMRLQGYVDAAGQAHNFNSIGEFNAVMAQQQAGIPWEAVQPLALRMASALYTLFSHPLLLGPAVLEQGEPEQVKFPSGKSITVPVGWALWYITLEHEGVEHAGDLGMV